MTPASLRPPASSVSIGIGPRLIVYAFGATMFLSAVLLFWIQLVIAKMLLPRLGGTPAVWNTCMLFFQVLLLTGYSYVLLTTAWIGARTQAVLQVLILLLSFVYLPFALDGNLGSIVTRNNPALWLFAYLLVAIGLPIFLISTTSPLLQKWFTRTSHPSANDPYFLFAVSNAGSLVGLLSYPLLLEPRLSLSVQNRLWVVIYVVFSALTLVCVFVLWRSSRSEKVETVSEPVLDETPVSHQRRLYWILLAFIPSSLLFGVTTYITTEIAPTPLLWTIPLALYLLTFVIAFARKTFVSTRLASSVLGGLALLLALVLAARATEPTSAIVLLHLAFFFVAAMLCHQQLASDRPVSDRSVSDRPAATRLPEFYLCVAAGGMLGGLFNTLIAPSVFNTIAEYPLVVVLACLIRLRDDDKDDSSSDHLFDFILPACIGLVTVALVFFIARFEVSEIAGIAMVFGIPLVIINHRFRNRPIRFALAIGAVLAGSIVYAEVQNPTLHVERNFFGSLSVSVDAVSSTRILYHGNTVHGRQFIDTNLQCEPLSYFHREGPLGQIFEAFNANQASPNVAIVGLGTGSMASYARPNQNWTFYEINPAVVRIAQTPDYFSYLENCAVAPVNIVLGDARLQLQNAPDQHYGLIVLDAFNSDAIPIHLMTREAIALYTSKLATGGLLAFHVSNRSLRLADVLAVLAKHHNLTSISGVDPAQDVVRGKDPSEWVVMARQSPAFDSLAGKHRWRPLEARTEADAWTDDFSNILRVFRWY
ncbi:MAG TPA: fused MFS/spermidine synthase [Pyrinomonadaceae bacterium]|nr:fused MFS/spermidine synthase [Pyrinomonadaceae bacterium]